MSASERTKAAASSMLRAINQLRSAGEYARSTDMKPAVEPLMVRTHELRADLLRLAEHLGLAEARRRVATRRQGHAA